MRSPLPAFQAFAHDARALASTEDERAEQLADWLAVAKAAERLSALAPGRRREYVAMLDDDLLPPLGFRPTLRHDALDAPSEPVSMLAERIRFAAEQMERGGCFELAFTTVSAVCQLTRDADVTARLTATVHLGRIARQLGDLDSATDCYEQVTTIGLRERDGPLAAHGFVGLGNVARHRGNRPAERASFERALSLAHPGGSVEASASQGLMNVAISEGRAIDALLHGWRAFDLVPDDTEVRAMILSNLALVSLQSDFAAAALNGFRHVLTLTDTARIRLPAIGGAMRAAARLRRDPDVAALNTAGDRESSRAQMPFESARFLMYAGEAWTVVNDRAFARRRYEDALALASAHGFHEIRLRVEDALAHLDHAPTPSPSVNRSVSTLALEPEGDAWVEAGIGRLEALCV